MRSSIPHLRICKVLVATAVLAAVTPAADKPSAADLEFFEAKIRPVFTKNCYGCHGGDLKAPMGGLFLDSRNGLLTGGKSGPAIVPGDANASLLIRAVRYQGPQMPPSGPLPDTVVADLVKWVTMGAPDPRQAQPVVSTSAIDIEKGRKYWAFQAPVKPATPKVVNTAWAAGTVDQFVLARMEKERLTPVADADRTTWIRRVTLDLIGLPPTPEEVDAFLADHSKTADAKVVDRLLASPRFGERWGRHWLDVARYSDTVGRGRNYAFPLAWKYRDWVIDALNSDMPYDEFVREQIAGDLLPSTSPAQHNAQLIASGFLALGALDLDQQNPSVFALDAADEKINATSRAFMGITVGCARCHDHKFDPIPTTDYYAMAGIFRSTETLSGLQRRPRDQVSYFSSNLLAKLAPEPGQAPAEFLPDPAQHAQWDTLQTQLSELTQTRRPPQKAVVVQGAQKGAAVQQNAAQVLRQQATQILGQLDRFPLPTDLAMGVRDSSTPADSEVYIKGEVKDLGPTVPRGFLQVMSRAGEAPGIQQYESGRLELAQWLIRRDNPTTARVAVNRIWEHLFGRGIVATADNFGKMGSPPSNQPLLDYLAVRFVQEGWSTKKLIRELVLSRTYRLSTAASARNEKVDPDNVYLWRANRERLEVEPIRDSLLMISGRLDLNKPSTPPSLNFRRSTPVGGGRGGQTVDYTETMRNRSVYLPVMRNSIPDMFETFDFPEPSETKGVREVTTVPTQALFLMNSRFVIEQARSAAEHLLAEDLSTPQNRVTRAYREVLGRGPTAAEVTRAVSFVQKAQEEAAAEPVEPEPAAAGRGRGGRGGGRGGALGASGRAGAQAGRGGAFAQGGRGAFGASGRGGGFAQGRPGAFAQGAAGASGRGSGAFAALAGRGRGGRGGQQTEAPLPRISPEASAWEHFYQALFASAEFRYRG